MWIGFVRRMNGMVRFVLQSVSIANIARRTKRRGMKGEVSSRCDVQQGEMVLAI